ncbi:calcium-binding protein [Microvirga terricola]|uniref:Calcium-binding protein n=1 Tax=Microvirga terricola TaxID=2719797 RepID=A0ABX0VFB9_9HYPH|nr:calcium-binding protein [Microvirga terricola]NIX78191.1 calcium-binding protein [Microvirga terricola]
MAQPVLSGSEQLIAGGTASELTALADGTLLAVWSRAKEGGGSDAVARVFNADGTPSGAVFVLASASSGFITSIAASVLGDGRYVVAWTQDDGLGATTIKSQIMRANHEADSGIIAVGAGTALSSPRIAALADGTYMISYEDATTVRRAFFDKAGVQEHDEPLSSHGSMPVSAGLTTGVGVTLDYVIPDLDPGVDLVAYVGSERIVTITHLDNVSSPPAIAALANGRFVAVWGDGVAAGGALKARIYDGNGTPVSDEILIYKNNDASVASPVVKALPDGGFAVAFSRYGADSDIVAATYNSSGGEVFAPFTIGANKTGDQDGHSLTVLNDGRFVTSWVDHNGDAAQTLSQIFDPRPTGVQWQAGDGGEQFGGTIYGDTLSGGRGDDKLYGYAGSDILRGGEGRDTLVGGAGDDVYYLTPGDAVIEERGGGYDTIIVGYTANLGNDTEVEVLKAQEGIANINLGGANKNDTLVGNSLANVLNGSTGADTMQGGAGNDTYYVDNAADKVVETSSGGTDTVITLIDYKLAAFLENLTAAGAASLKLTGNSLTNVITGNAGANVIDGGSGNDKLAGGLGKDTLKGGIGKDAFIFDTKLNAKTNVDKIVDFNVKDDTIHLAKSIFSKIAKKGALAKGAFWIGAAAHDKDDRIIYNDKTGALLYDADGSGKGKAMQFVTLSKNLKMTSADFFVI